MKKLLTNWKTWAAAALAAFVAFNEVAQVFDPAVQRTIIGIAAALGIGLSAHTDSKVEAAKTELNTQGVIQ